MENVKKQTTVFVLLQNPRTPAERGHGFTKAQVVAQGHSLRPVQFGPDTAARQRPRYPQLRWRLLRPGSRRGPLLPHSDGGKLVVAAEGVQSPFQGGMVVNEMG